MKRTSKRILLLATAVLTTLPGLTKAFEFYYDSQSRVRWSPYTHSLVCGNLRYSPYAKTYGTSGLVFYRTRYSPYALTYGSNGLVYDNVRYSPYAFGLKSSGLIAEPWGESYYCCYQRPCQRTSRSPSPYAGRSTPAYKRTEYNPRARLAERQVKMEQLRALREQPSKTVKYGAEDIISGFLSMKNIDFRINRILSIENNLISVDFILTDKNIIIKYWNPEKILALQKEKNSRILFYDSYLESYKNFAGNYLNSGGQIFQIITADKTEILARLLEFQKQYDIQEPCETKTVAKAGETSPAQAVAD